MIGLEVGELRWQGSEHDRLTAMPRDEVGAPLCLTQRSRDVPPEALNPQLAHVLLRTGLAKERHRAAVSHHQNGLAVSGARCEIEDVAPEFPGGDDRLHATTLGRQPPKINTQCVRKCVRNALARWGVNTGSAAASGGPPPDDALPIPELRR
jgi:hypothetical protein